MQNIFKEKSNSGFSAYPDGSPSELILVSGVVLYFNFDMAVGHTQTANSYCDYVDVEL
jgi:hypothetical protein